MAKYGRFIPGLVVALVNTALTIGGYKNSPLAVALWIVASILLFAGAWPYVKRIRVGLAPQGNPPGFAIPGRPLRPGATKDELASHYISDRTIWVGSLLDFNYIREKTLERCTIIGPALFANVSPGNEIGRCTWIGALPDYSNIFVTLPTRRMPESAIKLERVRFLDCDLLWCSVAGIEAMVESWKREGFGWHPSEGERPEVSEP